MLVFFYVAVEDHDTLFILAESIHFLGIGILAYKLLRRRNVGGKGKRASIFLQCKKTLSF